MSEDSFTSAAINLQLELNNIHYPPTPPCKLLLNLFNIFWHGQCALNQITGLVREGLVQDMQSVQSQKQDELNSFALGAQGFRFGQKSGSLFLGLKLAGFGLKKPCGVRLNHKSKPSVPES